MCFHHHDKQQHWHNFNSWMTFLTLINNHRILETHYFYCGTITNLQPANVNPQDGGICSQIILFLGVLPTLSQPRSKLVLWHQSLPFTSVFFAPVRTSTRSQRMRSLSRRGYTLTPTLWSISRNLGCFNSSSSPQSSYTYQIPKTKSGQAYSLDIQRGQFT